MCPIPYEPGMSAANAPEQTAPPTDFESLWKTPDPGFEHLACEQPKRPQVKTDYASLAGKAGPPLYTPPRTVTDTMIDALTPMMILAMVYAVIFFLLDVRYVYTEVNDVGLRWVAFCFVMGVVALNRLIAREGSQESYVYMFGLAMAIGLYTITSTGAFEMGSVTRNFMNSSPALATGFNMCLVAFIWWLVNRLTHECCVDENRSAGDVGILTGTARRWHTAIQKDPEAAPPRLPRRSIQEEISAPMYELEAFDPVEGYKPKAKPAGSALRGSTSDRLAGRHPGISIFYFSVPVMFIFALGLRIVQHGGEAMVKAGQFYMGIYTVSALMLLLLTSLGGLREYFRARKIAMPDRIGWFWIGLGVVMIAIVLVGASQLPLPSLPPIAYVDAHQTDYWSRGSKFQLSPVAAAPMLVLEQSRFVERVGQGVLIALGTFLTFGGLKGLGVFAARIARRRDLYPRFVVRFFDRLERLVSHLTRLPKMPERKRRIHIQRDIATSANYQSSFRDAVKAQKTPTRGHIEYAYEALCALAYDLGAPRKPDQTPFEFIEAFPEPLETLREEAEELTRLYVMAAYSPVEMSPQLEDRLRKFWTVYTRARNRVVR